MKMKISLSTIVLSLVVLILAGAVAMKISGSSDGAGPGGPGGAPGGRPGAAAEVSDDQMVISVNTITAEEGTVAEYIRLNGDVSAGTSIEIYPDTSGELIKRSVDVGDYVRKGQVIAEVDPSRPGSVYAASPVESTISGTVTRVSVDKGENVTTQQSVITVGDLRNLEIKAYVPERFIGGIKTGLKADVSFEPYPGETFTAEITEISPVLDSDSRTMEISLVLTGSRDSRIKAGMFASLVLYTQVKNDVVQIPADCLIESEDGSYIYLAQGDKAVKRSIETGLKSLSNVEVISGLDLGDTVIFRGQSLLSDGAVIKVLAE